MPSRAMYELRVTGLLLGPLSVNSAGCEAFRFLFPVNAPAPVPPVPPADWAAAGEPWPRGFILPGYDITRWASLAEEWPRERLGVEQNPGPELTTGLTFHAQLTRTLPGTLFGNRDAMLQEVNWFYTYCLRRWHQELRDRVKELNGTLAGLGQVLGVVDFRDWKWYCGNGGGS